MTVETLQGLPLIESLTQPVPDEVIEYIQNNIAIGTGPFGTLTVYDILGTAAGFNVTNWIIQVNTALGAIDLTNLKAVYDNMKACVQGTYGPVTGPVVIPSGPGSGTYATSNLAFTNGLIPAANAEIANIISNNSSFTDSMNSIFNAICEQIKGEANNQAKAGISYDSIGSPGLPAITSFVTSLPVIAQYNTAGGPVEFLAQVTDVQTRTGQAILAALREGNNQLLLGEVGITVESFNTSSKYPGNPNSNRTEIVTSSETPVNTTATGQPAIPQQPPENQSPSSPVSTSYTVADAQAVAQASPATVPKRIVQTTTAKILSVNSGGGTRASTPGPETNTVSMSRWFYFFYTASPTQEDTAVSFEIQYLTGGPENYNGTGKRFNLVSLWNLDRSIEGMNTFISVSPQFIPYEGTIRLTLTVGIEGSSNAPSDSVVLNVVNNHYPRSVSMESPRSWQSSIWYAGANASGALQSGTAAVQGSVPNREIATAPTSTSINGTFTYGRKLNLLVQGPPGNKFGWTVNWDQPEWQNKTSRTPTFVFDSDGEKEFTDLPTPPVGTGYEISIYYEDFVSTEPLIYRFNINPQ